jgi:hypothetical protein
VAQSTRLCNRSLFIVGAAILAGCASGASVNGSLAGQRSIETGAAPGDRLTSIPEFKAAERTTVPIPIADAWTKLSKAYADLGIPLTLVTPADHVLGNEGMRRTHTLANDRLSSFLDCGVGGGGANADMYGINMSVMSQLQPVTDGSTQIATMVQATAAPLSFGTSPVVCATTGALEVRIAAMVAGTSKK